MYSRRSAIWSTTNNHCDRSRSDGTMARSSLSQVSNILPASVLVFSNCWYSVVWTIGIAADDQNTFIRWSCCIKWYPEMVFIIDVDVDVTWFNLHHLMNIPISIREWVISQLFPFFGIIIQHFSLQSICGRIMSRYKRWVSVRSKRQDIIMRKLWWWLLW